MKFKLVMFRLKNILLYTMVLLLTFGLLLQSKQVISAVENALVLCYKTVIPSLFPFFILCGMLTRSSLIKIVAKMLSPVMNPIFSVGGTGALPFLIGIVSGYPTGAKVTAELYCSGLLSYRDAMRLLPFSNNSGPLFIIGAVGTAMLGDTRAGIFLYVIHILSAVLVGICFRFYKESATPGYIQYTRQVAQAPSFSDTMANGIHTMLLVCGFIIFFAAITACISPILSMLPKHFSYAITAMLEVTSGALVIVKSPLQIRLMFSFLSAVIGFGGICVMMQVSGITTPAGLSMKTYFPGKILHGLISGIICYLAYPLVSEKICPVFAASVPIRQARGVFPLIISFSVLLICIHFIRCKNYGKTAKN